MPNTTARDQCLCLFVFVIWLFKGKSKYMTKHLIDGSLGKLTLASFVFPRLCLAEHQDSWENKTVSLRNIHWVYIINPADKTTLSCYNLYWHRSWIIHYTTDIKVKDLMNNNFILQNKKDLMETYCHGHNVMTALHEQSLPVRNPNCHLWKYVASFTCFKSPNISAVISK